MGFTLRQRRRAINHVSLQCMLKLELTVVAKFVFECDHSPVPFSCFLTKDYL